MSDVAVLSIVCLVIVGCGVAVLIIYVCKEAEIPLVDYNKLISGVEFEEEENSLWITNTNDMLVVVKIVGKWHHEGFFSASYTSEEIYAIVRLETGQNIRMKRIPISACYFRGYFAYVSNVYGTQIGHGQLRKSR